MKHITKHVIQFILVFCVIYGVLQFTDPSIKYADIIVCSLLIVLHTIGYIMGMLER